MSSIHTPSDESLPLDALEQIDAVCVQFEEAWRSGDAPRIEDLLGDLQGQERAYLLLQLLLIEFNYRTQQEPGLLLDEYGDRFPDDSEVVFAAIDSSSSMDEGPCRPRR